MTITRRDALAMVAATAAAATAPVKIVSAATAAVAPRLPVWAVGTPGEYDWQMIRARTEDAARRAWSCEVCGEDKCEMPDTSECDCEFCFNFKGAEAQRFPQLDHKNHIGPADWFGVGMGHLCSRCGDEAHPDAGGRAVAEEAVCEACLTLADWDIIDPERAVEMRADAVEG